MVFRRYTPEDYMALSEMINALYREDSDGEPMDDTKIAATVDLHTHHSEKLDIILIEGDGTILGYALLVYAWSNEYGGNILHIDELYVKEAYRNAGIGTSFLQYIEETSPASALQLEVTPSNQKAMALYRRMGFLPSENTHLIKKLYSKAH